jgi:hypothetical protein
MSTEQDQLELFTQFLRAEQAKKQGGATSSTSRTASFFETPQFSVFFGSTWFIASILLIRQFGHMLA